MVGGMHRDELAKRAPQRSRDALELSDADDLDLAVEFFPDWANPGFNVPGSALSRRCDEHGAASGKLKSMSFSELVNRSDSIQFRCIDAIEVFGPAFSRKKRRYSQE